MAKARQARVSFECCGTNVIQESRLERCKAETMLDSRALEPGTHCLHILDPQNTRLRDAVA